MCIRDSLGSEQCAKPRCDGEKTASDGFARLIKVRPRQMLVGREAQPQSGTRRQLDEANSYGRCQSGCKVESERRGSDTTRGRRHDDDGPLPRDGPRFDLLDNALRIRRIEGDAVPHSIRTKDDDIDVPVSYTHLRAHETKANLVCRLLL